MDLKEVCFDAIAGMEFGIGKDSQHDVKFTLTISKCSCALFITKSGVVLPFRVAFLSIL
jgi:hypothetical protein